MSLRFKISTDFVMHARSRIVRSFVITEVYELILQVLRTLTVTFRSMYSEVVLVDS